MKKSIFLFFSLTCFVANAWSQLKPNPGFYPEGVFKKEQRIITTYTNKATKPTEIKTNMRSVGKAYVLKPGYRQDKSISQAAQNGLQHIEYTFTEISGTKSVDGTISDLGNPIEDHTVYAYRCNYNANGESLVWDGNPAYMSAMVNGNLQVLDKGYQCTYFLHTDVARNIGDVWVDSQFAYPLTKKFLTQFKFEKMEQNEYGVTVCRLAISGDIKVKGKTNVMKEVKEVDLQGNMTGFVQVSPVNNQIYRMKGEMKLTGQIMNNGKMEPYDVLLKFNEWELDPSNERRVRD